MPMPTPPSGGPTGNGARPRAVPETGSRAGAPRPGEAGSAPLFRALEAWGREPRARRTLLVGIDGPGGAGKSTLAATLAAWAVGVQVVPAGDIVRVDDFYRPTAERLGRPAAALLVAPDVDLGRLRRQVLAPLREDWVTVYQRYDWGTDALAEWHTVRPGGLVVVEGVYALLPLLADVYDLTVWVDCSREVRLARDGEAARQQWVRDWMPAEDRYMARYRPMDCASLRVSGRW